jgi:hypothetical protein
VLLDKKRDGIGGDNPAVPPVPQLGVNLVFTPVKGQANAAGFSTLLGLTIYVYDHAQFRGYRL